MTFIVRITRDEVGRLTGVVERVRTGEKVRCDSLEAIAAVIARIVARNREDQEQPGDERGSP